MNIIEKLEALIKLHSWDHEHANGDIEKLVSVDDLRAIIEEYKNAKPVVITTEMMAHIDTSMEGWQENTRVEVFHPPLLDETVKDAERYKFITENKHVPWGSILQKYEVHEIGIDAAIDEAMKADKS